MFPQLKNCPASQHVRLHGTSASSVSNPPLLSHIPGPQPDKIQNTSVIGTIAKTTKSLTTVNEDVRRRSRRKNGQELARRGMPASCVKALIVAVRGLAKCEIENRITSTLKDQNTNPANEGRAIDHPMLSCPANESRILKKEISMRGNFSGQKFFA
jgi:hypothetical protein